MKKLILIAAIGFAVQGCGEADIIKCPCVIIAIQNERTSHVVVIKDTEGVKTFNGTAFAVAMAESKQVGDTIK